MEAEWTEEYAAYKRGELVPKAAQTRYRHIDIKQTLRQETHDKCIYCESKISHVFPGEIDHIRPLSKRHDLVVQWENLAYICKECNREKSDYYSEAEPLINPYFEDPAQSLIFYGPIVLHRTGNAKGLRTLHQLKLKSRMSLVERRKERIEALQILLDLFISYPDGYTRKMLGEQIREACTEDKEFSACLKEFVRQSGIFEADD